MNHLTPDQEKDLQKLQTLFNLNYAVLENYGKERNIHLSPKQLFSFNMTLPLIAAVVLDGKVDQLEQEMLLHIKDFGYKFFEEQLSEDTKTLFAQLAQVENAVKDIVFQKKLEEEINYLIQNFENWRTVILASLKAFLPMEDIIRKYNPSLKPLQETIVETMYLVISNNAGDDRIEEERLEKLLKTLNIEVTLDKLKTILQK